LSLARSVLHWAAARERRLTKVLPPTMMVGLVRVAAPRATPVTPSAD
jgi:hypothetical protein